MKIFLQILVLFSVQIPVFGQQVWLQKAQMQHDLKYLKKAVAHGHVNPYYFRSESAIDQYLDSVQTQLPDSLTEFQFWQIVNKTLVFYNDAHTRTFSHAYLKKYKASGGTFFPAQVTLANNQLRIQSTAPTNANLEVNDQILAINGQTDQQIIQELRAHASKELTSLDDQMISKNFPYYWWLAYGECARFRLKIRKANTQKIELLELKSLPYRSPQKNQSRRAPANESFTYNGLNDSIGLIKIRDFYQHGRKYYRQKYEEAFAQITQNTNIKYLVLDFRGHDGGDARYGEDLGRYLTDQPFRAASVTQWKVSKAFKKRFASMYIPGALRWCRPLYMVNKHTRQIWRTKNGKLATVNHQKLKPHKVRKRFRGKVFLLTDHQTFSAGSIFAAMFQDYQMGTIVGQPTGSLSSFYADPMMWYGLPHSKIRFQVSASFIVRPNGSQKLETVQPDVWVPQGKDALEVVLELINGKGKLE
ncbi:MAG TPA: hypothetical protein DCS93_05370 [Microscillaceae bacterium]|nr:hypothetical protein [Microscillaceae bacterium]